MRKTFAIIMIALILLAGCSESIPSGTGTMRITLNQSGTKGTESNTFVPEGYSLEVESYHIYGTLKDSEAVIDRNITHSTETLDGIEYGIWTITATGLSDQGNALVTGTTEFTFTPNNQNVIITLDQLVGEGSYRVDFTWSTSGIQGTTELEVKLTPQFGDDRSTLTLVPQSAGAGKAYVSGTDLPAGSYVLSVRLLEDDILIGSGVAVLRIADKQESRGTVSIGVDESPTEPGAFVVINEAGVPVELFVELSSGEELPDQVTAGSPLELSIKSSADDDALGGLDVSWYYDGSQIGTERNVTITPVIGFHRIDVIASTSKLGSTGSTTVTFEAIAQGPKGTPMSGGIIEDIGFGAGGFVRFLDNGTMMIVSNADQNIRIAHLVKNSISIDSTIPFASIGISDEIIDIAAKPSTSELYTVAIASAERTLTLCSYHIPSMTLTKLDQYADTDNWTVSPLGTMSEIQYIDLILDDADYILVIGKFGAATSIPFIFQFPDNQLTLITANVTALECWENGGYLMEFDSNEDGFIGLNSDRYLDIFTPRDGYEYSVVSSESIMDQLTKITDVAMLGKSRYICIGDRIAIVECVYPEEGRFLQQTPIEGAAEALVVSKDYKYAYYIDSTENELVTIGIDSSRSSFSELGRTALPCTGLNQMLISSSGSNLILYDDGNTDDLVLMRINR